MYKVHGDKDHSGRMMREKLRVRMQYIHWYCCMLPYIGMQILLLYGESSYQRLHHKDKIRQKMEGQYLKIGIQIIKIHLSLHSIYF